MTEMDFKLPTHLGYIIDGNRRWARLHGLPNYEGHLAGYAALKEIVINSIERGVSFVSIYAFSTENWQREKGEVNKLLKLIVRLATTDLQELIDHNIRVRFLGTRLGLGDKVVEAMDKAENATKHLTAGTVLVCFNYGGQQEILDVIKGCIKDKLRVEDISLGVVQRYLYAPDVPEIDMVVRTSGEKRISNFMLWRIAYSELLFLDKYWPDMRIEDVQVILEEYNKRRRRFGGN